MALLNENNAILKQRRPEVTSSQDLLDIGIPRHMIATFLGMTVI
jgi:hypothetical protein